MVSSNLVLVASAGGVGRRVLDQLRAQDKPVRGTLRHDDARVAELRAFGAEVAIGDLTRPETVAAALEGVRRMHFDINIPNYASAIVTADELVHTLTLAKRRDGEGRMSSTPSRLH